ncbi:SAM-dependent DNA methyltransferase [Fimbriimonadia bacterium ATM]|nr:MAG: SAM-dependent DNA methyltransferase [Armatimonadota bacterium]MBC6970273.1 SAM-dependent DNA methyltransferase [Armatimonadota bacterium]MCE7899547.1 SAM-dependent DNA methyltransferase [Armatimonadetes bacterium ATM1]MDL1927635.1 SAM-dependent DNA methyltransferase [Fimbriimonadia bacterium ATM]RIJ96437.1 MAG: DNA methyltransferase [Armatimonadota bacterium]
MATRRVREKVKPYLPGAKTLDLSTLRNWLWDAACKIRGPVDAPRYKDYILPLIFIKRVSDVFEDEVERLAKELMQTKEKAAQIAENDHSLVRFFLPKESRWSELIKVRSGLGQRLTDAMRAFVKQNPSLEGVLDTIDFNATAAGQRVVTDDHLAEVMQVLNKHRLGLYDVQPDIIGDAYEYLIAKFQAGSGQSAGEYYTPRQVARLMAKLLDVQPGMEVYDPCCGSFSLAIKAHLELLERCGKERNGHWELPAKVPPVKLHGQEILAATYAMAKMNAFIHQVEADIRLGDTMNHPRFLETDGGLKKFDRVIANPMWNQDAFRQQTYENDTYGRFIYGIPPNSTADWGWIQHMLASLKPNGRTVVIIDTGAASRGSGNQGSDRERDIRKKIVEANLVEMVILMPSNIFANMSGPSVIMVLHKSPPPLGAKREEEGAGGGGSVLMINASRECEKGRPKNELTEKNIERIAEAGLSRGEIEAFSKLVPLFEIAKNDFNLSPSRYVSNGAAEDILPLEEAVVLLKEAEEERAEADERLRNLLGALGL